MITDPTEPDMAAAPSPAAGAAASEAAAEPTPLSPPVPPDPPVEELGAGVAWQHVLLAWTALTTPLRRRVMGRLVPMSWATRAYLLYNVVLYAVAAAAFLVPTPGLRVGRLGIGLVDVSAFHLLWGLSALVVCASQVAVLLSARQLVWLVCAIGTMMWATAWGGVTLLLAHIAGAYGGAVVWFWIVGVHLLFISNRLVAQPDLADPAGSDTAAEPPPAPPSPQVARPPRAGRVRRRASPPATTNAEAREAHALYVQLRAALAADPLTPLTPPPAAPAPLAH